MNGSWKNVPKSELDEITPILSEHSERKVIKPERTGKNTGFGNGKQSVKAYLPQLNQLTKFGDLLNNHFFG